MSGDHIHPEPTNFFQKHVFSVDHKVIAKQFLWFGLLWLGIGGLMAMIIRWQLANPGQPVPVIGNVLFFPMMFLSGATFPLEIMPERVRQVSELLPLTHVVKLLQTLWFGGTFREQLAQVALLLVLLVVGAALSAKLFRWE